MLTIINLSTKGFSRTPTQRQRVVSLKMAQRYVNSFHNNAFLIFDCKNRLTIKIQACTIPPELFSFLYGGRHGNMSQTLTKPRPPTTNGVHQQTPLLVQQASPYPNKRPLAAPEPPKKRLRLSEQHWKLPEDIPQWAHALLERCLVNQVFPHIDAAIESLPRRHRVNVDKLAREVSLLKLEI